MEITVIGIIDFGGVTSSFGFYLYSARKVDNTGYSYLISNAYKLKKYILITMNCCNRQLLLPLEGDGLTGDDIILPCTWSQTLVNKAPDLVLGNFVTYPFLLVLISADMSNATIMHKTLFLNILKPYLMNLVIFSLFN